MLSFTGVWGWEVKWSFPLHRGFLRVQQSRAASPGLCSCCAGILHPGRAKFPQGTGLGGRKRKQYREEFCLQSMAIAWPRREAVLQGRRALIAALIQQEFAEHFLQG